MAFHVSLRLMTGNWCLNTEKVLIWGFAGKLLQPCHLTDRITFSSYGVSTEFICEKVITHEKTPFASKILWVPEFTAPFTKV